MRAFALIIARRFRAISEHPVTKLCLGVLLVLTASYEIEGGLVIELAEQGPGAHHGVAGFGLLTMASALPDLIEGLTASAEHIEQLEERSRAEQIETSR